MEGKFTKSEKMLLKIALAIIIEAPIAKLIMGANDIGVLIFMVFAAVLIYVIFLVAALFPADWRMTERQKSKIADKEKYQAKYRNILVWVNVAFCLFFGILVVAVG